MDIKPLNIKVNIAFINCATKHATKMKANFSNCDGIPFQNLRRV